MRVVRRLGFVAVTMCVWTTGAAAQDGSWPERQWYLSAGVQIPHGDLPRRDTPWGTAQGRFTAGPGVWLDGVFPDRRRPLRLHVQALAAGSSVRWVGGSGTGASGLVGSVTGGVEAGSTSGAVRPYVRAGVGASVYLLVTGGDCIPESPTCGLAAAYADNVVDPAVAASAGLEARLGGRSVNVGVNASWSRFEVRDGVRPQRFLSLGMGLGL